MYRCEQCKEVVGPLVAQVRVVAETRVRQYPVRPEVNRVKKRGRVTWVDDAGGEGRELARELVLCPRCVSPEA